MPPCPHNPQKSACKICTPCPHGGVKYQCLMCNECKHGQHKLRCRECNACSCGIYRQDCEKHQKCTHRRVRRECPKCKAALPCPHGVPFQSCPQCRPCDHEFLERNCILCNGCPHEVLRHDCPECKTCECGLRQGDCAQCKICECGAHQKDCATHRHCRRHGALEKDCEACKALPARPRRPVGWGCEHMMHPTDPCDDCEWCDVHETLQKDCGLCKLCDCTVPKRFFECMVCNFVPCPCGNRPEVCPRCNFDGYLTDLVTKKITRVYLDTGFPQSRDALQDLGCSIQEFRKFLAHKIVHYNCQPENHDERMNLINVHIGFIRPPQSFFICKDAVMPRTCRQRCQKSDYSYHSLDRIDIVKEEIGIVKPLITSAMGKEPELQACLHYTNWQPLLAKHVAKDCERWTISEQAFWAANIHGKRECRQLLIPPLCTCGVKRETCPKHDLEGFVENCMTDTISAVDRQSVHWKLRNGDPWDPRPALQRLGCSTQEFIDFIQQKMDRYNKTLVDCDDYMDCDRPLMECDLPVRDSDEKMDWDNTLIWFIKPWWSSRNRYEGPHNFMHYSNWQPLLRTYVEGRSEAWDFYDERFWNSRIRVTTDATRRLNIDEISGFTPVTAPPSMAVCPPSDPPYNGPFKKGDLFQDHHIPSATFFTSRARRDHIERVCKLWGPGSTPF